MIHPLHHAVTEGPLGFPVTDRQAIALESILKALPRDDAFKYRKCVITKAASEVMPGERSDVSWISTETTDRLGDVMIARGMNDSQFKLNPVVTLEHNYQMPPVGKSLWRKVVKDGARHGVKAKTQYTQRPGDWPATRHWPADYAFSLVQAGLLQGKSIGALPLKLHYPTQEEIDVLGRETRAIYDEWLLLEYACTMLPVQQEAIVQAVNKGEVQLPKEMAELFGIPLDLANHEPPVPGNTAFVLNQFTPLEEIEKNLTRRLQGLDIKSLADRIAQDALDRLQGRV